MTVSHALIHAAATKRTTGLKAACVALLAITPVAIGGQSIAQSNALHIDITQEDEVGAMAAGETDALRLSVQQCWNIGALSPDANHAAVTVRVNLSREGVPDPGSIRMVGAKDATPAAAEQAFAVARRAILTCGQRGFPLPADKYDHWKTIELTFDPEEMRIR